MIKRGWEKIRLTIMFSPPKLVLLVFIIVSLVSLLFQLASFLLSPSKEESASCSVKKAAILEDIARQGVCQQDSDCQPLRARCPFHCIAVHQDSVAALSAKIQQYTNECGLCVSSECSATTASQAQCVNQRCVIVNSP